MLSSRFVADRLTEILRRGELALVLHLHRAAVTACRSPGGAQHLDDRPCHRSHHGHCHVHCWKPTILRNVEEVSPARPEAPTSSARSAPQRFWEPGRAPRRAQMPMDSDPHRKRHYPKKVVTFLLPCCSWRCRRRVRSPRVAFRNGSPQVPCHCGFGEKGVNKRAKRTRRKPCIRVYLLDFP